MGFREPVSNLTTNLGRRRAGREYTPPLKAAILFSIPPVLILAGSRGWVSVDVVRLAAVAVIGVTVGYNFSIKGYYSGDFDPEQFDLSAATAELRECVWVEADDAVRDDALLLEYEQLSHEIRSANNLAIRATYFSLATLGILATVFFSITESVFQPFLAEFGMFIAFAFLVMNEKHVILREVLRSRQREIERRPSVNGTLTLSRTWDVSTNYGEYPSADIEKQLVDFNRFWLWAWIAGYHASLLYTAFYVLPSA